MNGRTAHTLLVTAALAGGLASVGCGDNRSGEVMSRDQDIDVSADDTKATRSKTQVRQTESGAVVRETKTQTRTVEQPAPNSAPDATQRDATK